MSPPPSGVPGRCTGQELTLDHAWLSSLAYLGREWYATDPLAMATDDLMKVTRLIRAVAGRSLSLKYAMVFPGAA